MALLKKATIKSYNSGTHKADVQIAGSLAVWLDGIRVATNIPAADVITGRQCSVLFLDPSNQDDAVVITIQDALPSSGGGVTDHGALTGLGDDDHTQYQKESEKGAANGYASLDGSADVPIGELPDKVRIKSINFVIDGGGSAITTGSKGHVHLYSKIEVLGWTVTADASGSIVVDVKKAAYSGFPTFASIAGTEKPTLSTAQKNQDLTLTTWTTTIDGETDAPSILEFVVDSAATVQRVTVSLKVRRT